MLTKFSVASRASRWSFVACLACTLTACGGDDDDTPRDDERDKYLNETSTNWAMVRGYPRGTAFNPYERELNTDTAAALRIVWQRPSRSAPLVQSGARLVASYSEAFSAADGAPLWADTNGSSVAPIAICKGTVFGMAGGVVGTNLGSGQRVVDVASSSENAALLFGAPVAKAALVIVPSLLQGWQGLGGAETTRYRAFDVQAKLTNTLRVDFVSLAPVAVTGGRAYVPGVAPNRAGETTRWAYSVYAVALGPAGGERVAPIEWATQLDAAVEAVAPDIGVAVIDHRVYATNATRTDVVALAQKSGQVVWRTNSGATISSLATSFDFVYTAGRLPDGTSVVQAFAAKDGAKKFETALGSDELTGRLALGGDVLYVGDASGKLYALSAADGRLSSTVAVGGRPTDPVVARGRVFVATGESVLALGVNDELGPEAGDAN